MLSLVTSPATSIEDSNYLVMKFEQSLRSKFPVLIQFLVFAPHPAESRTG
jgi:hypothetical protein